MSKNGNDVMELEFTPEARMEKLEQDIRYGLDVAPSDDLGQDIKTGIENKIKELLEQSLSSQGALGYKLNEIRQQIDAIHSNPNEPNPSINTAIRELEAQCATLRGQYVNLKNKYNDLKKKTDALKPGTDTSTSVKDEEVFSLNRRIDELDKQVKELKSQVALKKKTDALKPGTDTSTSVKDEEVFSLNRRIDELDNQMKEIFPRIGEIDAGRKAAASLSDFKKSHAFGKCIFLCAILLFNIIAAPIIICCPGYLEGADPLPWFGIVPLMACLVLNMGGTSVWLHEYYRSEVFSPDRGNIIFTIVAEGILLALNTVAMWLFAFHPLTGITDASIALTVMLVLANFVMLMLRVMHFLNEYAHIDVTLERLSWVMNILCATLAPGILIALIVAAVA